MVKNVYIHIPFCKSKCNYCSFISYPCISLKEKYLDALEKEILYYYSGEKLDTLYFGGGTPSLLTIDEFKRIIARFNITGNGNNSRIKSGRTYVRIFKITQRAWNKQNKPRVPDF